MEPNTQRFLDNFKTAYAAGHFLKCTLSKPTPAAPEGLKNIYQRPVDLKKGPHIAFTFRYKTRDEVKNFTAPEAARQLEQLLGTVFLNADLFTTEQDISISFGKNGLAAISLKKPAQTAPADTRHNREKQRLLDPAAPWLHELGITNAKGEVLHAAQDKWKQINKFLEIIEGLLHEHPLPPDAQIADMGSGKGYLTFALYDFLSRQMGLNPHITGIELRQNLVDFCNKTAQKAGFAGLHFIANDINDFQPERLDLLIALHACDTATDLALAKGIHARAGIVIVAPCCHKQIRRDMETHNELEPILRHGILEERQAEIVTDGIRALLLEANGYKTNVFEFISTEHTAKNVMITAINGRRWTVDGRRAALEKVAALKAGFGIQEHYLEKLL
ncbi:MAG: SAM-dependent methyltransferase [Thermoanaerobaculia bacterium]|nr:SAM-dependent methyltransferase [Thermoanaerobaculia bacterium]